MRVAIACVLLACGHRSEPAVTVKVTCPDHETSLVVRGAQRIEQLCGAPWKALRVEHGEDTELVRPVAGREVWVRRVGSRAVIDVRAGAAIVSSFDGCVVANVHSDTPRALPLPESSASSAVSGRFVSLPFASISTLAFMLASGSSAISVTPRNGNTIAVGNREGGQAFDVDVTDGTVTQVTTVDATRMAREYSAFTTP